MSKTVTLRLDDVVYNRMRMHAVRDNRPLSNLIETAALRYLETVEYADEFEEGEIRTNEPLQRSLRKGLADAKARRGQFV
jgi:predicted transcriptional regulator